MKKILLIEDDLGIIRVVGDRLKANRYDFYYSNSGTEGLKKALEGNFDLLLIDLMLPEVSGFDIIRELRSRGKIEPIIILSAKFQLSDKVSGLRIGADDYLVKPFDFDELLARIESNLRRKELSNIHINSKKDEWMDYSRNPISFGDCIINFQLCCLLKKGVNIQISNIEFRLLAYLIINSDRVVTIDELLEKVWKYDDSISTRTLYVHIAWLRKKISSSSKSDQFIKTVRGIG
ncbi:MAG: response regulator transcription factor, partial [Spirochaetales bacterium]|nr:response regulator transcription factor [Spirochaetales bacterium]